MCSDKIRYYRAGGMIYVFNLVEKKAWKYGFKPFNKRVRFRDPSLFHSFPRFYLLCFSECGVSDPEIYLERCETEWRELKLGISYL